MNLTINPTNTMTAISTMAAITTPTDIVAIITFKFTACGPLDGGGVREEEGAGDDGSVISTVPD